MPPPAESSRRTALIVATSSYQERTLAHLRAPGTDARELATVLADERIGGFDVHTFLNAGHDQLMRGVLEVCGAAGPADFLLVYLSCHGVMDDRGRLYYATTDTERRFLPATAISASWLNEQLEDCRARRQVLLLDCCHSGAFARGAKGDSALALQERFPGRGKVVLTASRATEYSFEGEDVVGQGISSVFTQAIVQGLQTGEADLDSDGDVTVTDLYQYVFDKVRQAEARQTPGMWTYGTEGELLVARSVRELRPAKLPDDLVHVLASPRPRVRASGVAELAEILDRGSRDLALTAENELKRMAEEEVPSVAKLARDALEAVHGEAKETVDTRIQNLVEAPRDQPGPVADLPYETSDAKPLPADPNDTRPDRGYRDLQSTEARADDPTGPQDNTQSPENAIYPDAIERRWYPGDRGEAAPSPEPNRLGGRKDLESASFNDQVGSTPRKTSPGDRDATRREAPNHADPAEATVPVLKPGYLLAAGALIALVGISRIVRNEYEPVWFPGQSPIFQFMSYAPLVTAQVLLVFAGLPLRFAVGRWLLWGAAGASFLIWMANLAFDAKDEFKTVYEVIYGVLHWVRGLCGLTAAGILALSTEARPEVRWLLVVLYVPGALGFVLDVFIRDDWLRGLLWLLVGAGLWFVVVAVKELRRPGEPTRAAS